MGLPWIQLLAGLLLLRHAASTNDTREEIRAVGKSVTFHIPDTDTEGNSAVWSFENIPIVSVEFGDPPLLIFHQRKFQTRLAVSEGGRALSISQLSTADAGTYSATIGGKTSTFRLLVYRELGKPSVSCEVQNCSGGSCSFSLRCSAHGPGLGNVSYSWSPPERPGSRAGEPAVLLLNGSSGAEPPALTCTARNAVSSSSVTVSAARELCTEISTHPPGPGPLSDRVMVGLAAGAGAVGILLVLLLLWKSKGWRRFHLSKSRPTGTVPTAENATVYAEVGPSQQQIPNGIKAKPRGQESSTTIYSLVKRPGQEAQGAEEHSTMACLELV